MMPDAILYKVVPIEAPLSAVWDSLTNPDRIKAWMWDTDVSIDTDWSVGSPIRIQGDFHGIFFENRGTVLQYLPNRTLQYTYWSTLSEIADVPENYSVIEFRVEAHDNRTTLTFRQSQFATYAIYKHFAFYWNTTLHILKQRLETDHSVDQPYPDS